MKFSFIIPVYNVEKTIGRCINSIIADINQSRSECEIIVIDNGSIDNSRNIIVELKQKYLFVRLFECEKGVSRARNIGIQKAIGEKIIFVDADDIWILGSLERIKKLICTNDSQLIQFAYYKNETVIKHDIITNQVISDDRFDQYRAWMISQPTTRMQVWAKVFDNKILVRNKILFNENLSYSEDGDFVFRYMQKINNILVVNYPVYKYCQDSYSTMRSYNTDRILGYKNSLECTKMYLNQESELIENAFNKYILINLNVILVHNIFDIKYKITFSNRKDKLLDVLDMSIFSDALASIGLKECLCVNLLPELLLKLRMNSFCGLLCMMKSKANYREYNIK